MTINAEGLRPIDTEFLNAEYAQRAHRFVATAERIAYSDAPPLIGFGGPKEHGKDTAADHLVHRYGFVKLGMSDPMIAAAYEQNPWIRLEKNLRLGRITVHKRGEFVHLAEILDTVGYTKAKTYREVRQYFQKLGTEVGRNIAGEDVWADIAERAIEQHRAAGRPVAITGIRYPNELTMIQRQHGLSSYVFRPGYPVEAGHSSETSLHEVDFDVTILNDGTLEDLHRSADTLMHSIQPRRVLLGDDAA